LVDGGIVNGFGYASELAGIVLNVLNQLVQVHAVEFEIKRIGRVTPFLDTVIRFVTLIGECVERLLANR
jgi:hypothetical protein